MAFRFIHTADLHLDSPLRSLALRNPALAERVGDATRQALVAIVDMCLAESVDALVIAGDLYDGDQTSMKTARFLATQMARLNGAGIRVLKIRGNHDAMSRITKQLVLPDNVTIFGGRAQTVVHSAGGVDVAFHGLSFASPKAPEGLLPRYAAGREGIANVGIMHTSLAGSPGHDVYSPCNVAELHAHGFDYWALGHIHVRKVHAGKRTVVMPGMPQGRDINESGEKSVTLVTIRDDRSIAIETRPTTIAQFERLEVDLTGTAEWAEATGRIQSALEHLRASVRAPDVVVRVGLTGTSPLAWALIRDADLLLAEAEQAAERTGATWVEKLHSAVVPLAQPASVDEADPLLELAQSMRLNARSEAFRAEARALIHRLVGELPPDGRDFAGRDEAGMEAFLDTVLASGVDLVTARLKASGAQ